MTADSTPADPPAWAPLTGRDLPALAALAARVFAADGGLPLIAETPFLARRYAADGADARGARAGDGTLLAAASVRPGPRGPVATGMVDPAARGRGLGGQLLDWALATARATAGVVAVETESLTPPAAALFTSRGLRQSFAEDVLRLPLAAPPPEIPLPAGVRLESWTPALAERFHAVWSSAFAERPGFPGWSAARWTSWLTEDDEFRPDRSLLAVDPAAGDVAYVACAVGWIVQVGVRPDQRGRRLGAGLVAEALRRMRAAGEPAALLDVNVDNPARDLYLRLGFRVTGRRARFVPAAPR